MVHSLQVTHSIASGDLTPENHMFLAPCPRRSARRNAGSLLKQDRVWGAVPGPEVVLVRVVRGLPYVVFCLVSFQPYTF